MKINKILNLSVKYFNDLEMASSDSKMKGMKLTTGQIF